MPGMAQPNNNVARYCQMLQDVTRTSNAATSNTTAPPGAKLGSQRLTLQPMESATSYRLWYPAGNHTNFLAGARVTNMVPC